MKTRLGPSRAAFTITELMVSIAVVFVILGSVLSCHLFGMRLFQLTKAKLGANQDSRKAVTRLTDEVRSAKWLRVGNGNGRGFEPCDDGDPQQGNALELYSTSKSEPWTRYYVDGDKSLKRITSANSKPQLIAQNISNSVVFASENCKGQVLTNNENNRVVSLTMSFYQIQYPIVKVGPGEYYDYYQLRTRITRRNLE